MPVIDNVNPLLIIASITGLLSVYYLFSLLSKLKKLKLVSTATRLVGFTFLTSITTALSLIVIGTQGYKGLTREEPAAIIKLTPTGSQSFQARMILADGSHQVFSLEGDELLVDAYVLKWKAWANILGLHSAYRIERVAGRYKDLAEERAKPRTVFAVNNMKGNGIAQWREDYSLLSFLLDVEHGSASFVDANRGAEYQLMVTTDGLLIRSVGK